MVSAALLPFTTLALMLPAAFAQSAVYGQCGGIGWTGPTTCVSGAVCTYSNDYYSQCLPSAQGSTTSSAPASSTKTTTATAPTSSTSSSGGSCVVNSVASASSLSSCTTVTVNSFTVPSGQTVTIAAASGATINWNGTITFAQSTLAGPLLTINTANVKFNGNGKGVDGQGALYWDGQGGSGGVAKPAPLVKFNGSGTFTGFKVLNSPCRAISIGTSAASTFSGFTIDNSAGASLGKNTDGFDVSANSVTITGSTVLNQDDCVALNKGTNFVFSNNKCDGGHGISIGSISDASVVSGVTISGNTVTNSMYGMRIKVKTDATGSVSNVTYIGNSISANDKYGFLITQSYSDDFGTPGTASTISGITFSGATTTVTTSAKYPHVGVDCGHCTGTWDWSSLKASGGNASDIVLGGGAKITGGSY